MIREFPVVIFIFANAVFAGTVRETSRRSGMAPRVLPEPPPAVYDVPETARDPFSLPGVQSGARARTAKSPAARRGVTAGEIQAALHLQLASVNAAGEAVALVNGTLVAIGGKLSLTVQGRKIELSCTRIEPNPPKVVFKWNNVLLSIGGKKAQHKGEGK